MPTTKTLASCEFVERKENVIFVGQPGTGKTHLAIALGMNAHLVPIVGDPYRMKELKAKKGARGAKKKA